jgi:VanZ family protein
MSRERGRALVLAWLPVALYMALIWILSSFPLPELPIDSVPLRDKGVHLVEYAGLAFFVQHATSRSWPTHSLVRVMLLAVVVTGAWGLLDELHQAFVPGRSADLLDLAADVAGAMLGTGARAGLSRLRRIGSPLQREHA